MTCKFYCYAYRDRKKKKFVGKSGNQGKNKKIKTESGQWISASYKSDAYKVCLSMHVLDTVACDHSLYIDYTPGIAGLL